MTYKELYTKYKLEALELNKEETAIKLLIQELSNFTSAEFYYNYEKEIQNDLLKKIKTAIKDYLYKNIPIQYILGYTYFYGYKLIVNKNVLIPRRETEELVDWIIHNNPIENPNILDIGVGSGAIAIVLSANLLNSNVTAVDISEEALEVAKINAQVNNQNIKFLISDVFSNVQGKFDIIVSNPPYIDKNEKIDSLVYDNEPHLALFAEDKGLYYYKKIIKESINFIKPKSLIVFEIPENKDKELTEIVQAVYPDSEQKIIKDLQNKSRILIIKNNWR